MQTELVFIPSPGIGHIKSTTALANLLVNIDKRLSVTLIIMPPQFSTDASPSFTESQDRLRYRLLPPGDQSPNQTIFSYIESQIPHIRTAISELSSLRLSGIVVDMFCTSMIDIAEEFNIPAYIFYTSNASYLGMLFQIQSLYDEKILDVSELKDSDVEFEVPTLTRRFPAKCIPSPMLTKEWLRRIVARVRRMRAAKGILVNSVAEMETKALEFFSGVDTPTVYAVGPILDLQIEGNDEKRIEILRWLDEQPPKSVVFLCFGSMGGFGEEQTREIAVAIERSGYRFLWSLRRASPLANVTGSLSDDFANLEEVLPEGFLNRTAEIGKIISWAPQVDILKNPAVGGFVTHCGWNSILESLWFGVPMAAWPIYAEQQFNAFHVVEELGLATEIRMDYRSGFLAGETVIVTVTEIERGIRCVMEQDSEMRKRVKQMSDKLHVALMDGGSLTTYLRNFVEDVVKNIP